MHELTDSRFLQVLTGYDACCLRYCLLRDDRPYAGESSHRRALLSAIEKASAAVREPWVYDLEKAQARPISPGEWLSFPPGAWKETRGGVTAFDSPEVNGKIPYWYAFVEPPCGSGPVYRKGKMIRSEYGREDFDTVNTALFPAGTHRLLVYDWSTDWSDFFDAGHEGWGTGCWSAYDPVLDRYAVVLASATD